MADANHALKKDPSALTPLESQIYGLHKQGLNSRKISDALGGKWTPKNVHSRLMVIREKLACQTNEGSRR